MSVLSTMRSSFRIPFTLPQRSNNGSNPFGAVSGAAAIVLVYLGAVLAVHFAPSEALAAHLPSRLLPPGGEYWLGTDGLGHDMLWQFVAGAQWSIPVSFLATALGAILGTPAGIFAGWTRSRWSSVIMRVVDSAQAFPFIVLAIAVIAILKPGFGPLVCTLAFGSFIAFARTSYLETRRVAGLRYIEASLSLGVRPSAVVRRHVLPNIRHTLLVVFAFTIADTTIAEAGLSYLGVGAPSGTISWGSMLSDGQQYMQTAWWLVVTPAAAVMLLVLTCNYIGDSLGNRR